MRTHVGLGLVLALAGALGCRQSAGPATVSPGAGEDRSHPEAVGPHEGDTALELEARLKRLRAEQAELQAASTEEPAVCEAVCSLATRICGVREKLCNIADDHPEDSDYQQLCREAKLECQQAQEACVACVERHKSPAG